MKKSEIQRNISKNLSDWIIDFDNKFMNTPQLIGENKEIVLNIYNLTSQLRNNFHQKYLPKLYQDLNCHSSRDIYHYEFFFKEKEYPQYGIFNYNKKNLKSFETNYSTTNLGIKCSNKKKNQVIDLSHDENINYENEEVSKTKLEKYENNKDKVNEII